MTKVAHQHGIIIINETWVLPLWVYWCAFKHQGSHTIMPHKQTAWGSVCMGVYWKIYVGSAPKECRGLCIHRGIPQVCRKKELVNEWIKTEHIKTNKWIKQTSQLRTLAKSWKDTECWFKQQGRHFCILRGVGFPHYSENNVNKWMNQTNRSAEGLRIDPRLDYILDIPGMQKSIRF